MNLFVCVVDREGLGLFCKGERVRLAFQVYKMGEGIIYCRLLYDRCSNIYVCVCFFTRRMERLSYQGLRFRVCFRLILKDENINFKAPRCRNAAFVTFHSYLQKLH